MRPAYFFRYRDVFFVASRCLVTRPKYPPVSRDRCSNTTVALFSCGIADSRCYTPTSFCKNGLSQSKFWWPEFTRVPTKVGFLYAIIPCRGSHVSAHAGAHASVHEVVWSYVTWSVFTCSACIMVWSFSFSSQEKALLLRKLLRVHPFLVSRSLFCGIEVALVSFLVSRSLFWYRDTAFCCSASRSSSSWDQPVRAFLGLDILYIGGQRRSRYQKSDQKTSRPNKKGHLDTN